MTDKPETASPPSQRDQELARGLYPAGPTPAGPDHTDAQAQADMEVYTPAEAAEKLKVPESWLRKKATQRAVPCTFIGKHLRFSAKDLAQIVRDGAQEAVRSKHSDSRGRQGESRQDRRPQPRLLAPGLTVPGWAPEPGAEVPTPQLPTRRAWPTSTNTSPPTPRLGSWTCSPGDGRPASPASITQSNGNWRHSPRIWPISTTVATLPEGAQSPPTQK